MRNVALEFGFGLAGGLKIQPIESLEALAPNNLQRRRWAASPKRHAQCGNRLEEVGSEESAVPNDIRAPIMTDDDRLPFVESVDQRNHVADEIENRISLNRFGRA